MFKPARPGASAAMPDTRRAPSNCTIWQIDQNLAPGLQRAIQIIE
jgi:hypothetical protein